MMSRIHHLHIALCGLLLCISLKIPLNNCAHFGERFRFVGQFSGHRLKISSHNEGSVHKGEFLQFSAKFESLPCPVL